VTLPQLSVRVAFGSNPLDPTLTWTEIGPASGAGPGSKGWARKITTKRGRERLLRTRVGFQPGTATVALDNRDRRFDPTNTAGPYWPNVQPEKVIQVGATWSGTFYPIWTGYVDDWPQAWPGFSEAETAVAATDYFKALSIVRVLSSGYPKQVLADGATGYWRLGDAVGSAQAADSAGTNPATILTAAGPVAFGNSPLLVGLPATSALVSSNTSGLYSGFQARQFGTPSSASGVTVEWWAQPGSNSEMNTILPMKFGSSTYAAFLIARSATQIEIGDWGAGAIVYATTPNTQDGNPHHFVFAINTAWAYVLYMDGVSVVSGTIGGGLTPLAAVNIPAPQINAYSFSGTATIAFQEWAIYPVALSNIQAANHYYLAAFRAQYTGQYITQVLENWLGYPSSRSSIATGYTYCQADTQSEFNTKAIDFLQKLEQTEQGQLYVAADGTLVFQDRYHRYTNPNLTPQATIGDGGSAYPAEIPFAMGGVTLNFDRVELFNDIACTRRGGYVQEATNPASITAYGNRGDQGLTDLLMAADVDALYCAQWVLADTAYPQFRVGTLVIDPRVDDRWWPVILGLDIGAVVTVNKHNIPGGGAAVSLVCRIEGIEHQIDPPNQWITTWHVSLMGTQPWLILDDPVTGLLDSGNRWGW
jgi:hypothetical protein